MSHTLTAGWLTQHGRQVQLSTENMRHFPETGLHPATSAAGTSPPVVAIKGVAGIVLQHNVDHIPQLYLERVQALGWLQRHGAGGIKNQHIAAIPNLQASIAIEFIPVAASALRVCMLILKWSCMQQILLQLPAKLQKQAHFVCSCTTSVCPREYTHVLRSTERDIGAADRQRPCFLPKREQALPLVFQPAWILAS